MANKAANADAQKQQLAETGFHEALQRLRDRITKGGLADSRVTLAELLGWAYSLDEWHEAHLNRRNRR